MRTAFFVLTIALLVFLSACAAPAATAEPTAGVSDSPTASSDASPEAPADDPASAESPEGCLGTAE
ncbi:MAG TPA: hypothetical protein VFF68_10385, partial [Anaerolineaceae bacterium]|nr:hypothetical protein [Anaerolineaceae bacterium]